MDRKKKYTLEGAIVEIKFEDRSLDDFEGDAGWCTTNRLFNELAMFYEKNPDKYKENANICKNVNICFSINCKNVNKSQFKTITKIPCFFWQISPYFF